MLELLKFICKFIWMIDENFFRLNHTSLKFNWIVKLRYLNYHIIIINI